MSWFFGNKNNRKEIDARMDHLAESLQQIQEVLLAADNRAAESRQQQAELSDQLTKLMRLQYKTGQETRGKM